MAAMRAQKKVCVLVSGGLDSAALIAHYADKGFSVQPMYLAGGLRWEAVEVHWMRRFLASYRSRRVLPLRVLRVDYEQFFGPRHWSRRGKVPGLRAAWDSVYLDGRNLLLLTQAGVLCAQRGINRMALAVLKGNPFRDATPRFYRSAEKALYEALGRKFRIEAPFAGWEKEDVIKGFPGLRWELTFSCIEPKGKKHCGACTKCFERLRAFKRAKSADPAPYARGK